MNKKLIVLMAMFIVLSIAIELAAGALVWNDEELESLDKVERRAILRPYCRIHAVRCGPTFYARPVCLTYRKVCPILVG